MLLFTFICSAAVAENKSLMQMLILSCVVINCSFEVQLALPLFRVISITYIFPLSRHDEHFLKVLAEHFQILFQYLFVYKLLFIHMVLCFNLFNNNNITNFILRETVFNF